jgi:hypothetical protein
MRTNEDAEIVLPSIWINFAEFLVPMHQRPPACQDHFASAKDFMREGPSFSAATNTGWVEFVFGQSAGEGALQPPG